MVRYLIVVAGGKGLRMGTDIPKQFLPVKGIPILMHTIKNFHDFDSSIHIILVLPSSQIDFWNELCTRHTFDIPHIIVEGGDTRFHSVRNGLKAITEEEALVAVHDGVRPFVSHGVMANCFDTVLQKGAVVPVIPIAETLRKIDTASQDTTSTTVNRNEYCLVQTPQIFKLSLLRAAYSQPYATAFTDDASVVEAFGHSVSLVNGNRENIKVTTPFDLRLAETLCAR